MSQVLLHNSLIISLFDATKYLKRPPTPPPEQPKPPPRKRRRTLPYQGPDFPDEGLRSARLKRWTLSVGKRERDRVRNLQTVPPPHVPPRPRRDMDEIARERGIELLSERGGVCFDISRISFHREIDHDYLWPRSTWQSSPTSSCGYHPWPNDSAYSR